MTPQEAVREQCKATFQYDRVGTKLIDEMGVETLMWGSDYPHPDGVRHKGPCRCATVSGASTSTFALTNATLPYVLQLADHGVPAATRADLALAKGVNVCHGKLVHPAVAVFVGEAPTPLERALSA